MHGSAGELQIDLVWERQVTVPRLPVAWLSDEDKAAELQRVQARRAVDAAYEAELILALADQRPATLDPPPNTAGARRPGWTSQPAASAGVSEFFTAELSTILNLGRGTAANRLTRALTWRHKLPATFTALAAGELDERRAGALADVLAATTADVAGRVEDALLPAARELSVYRLTDRATALMLEFDAAAAEERRAEAERTADVKVYPSAADGRATLAADLPTDQAAECFDLVDQLARMLKADGDRRPIGQLRAHVLSVLIRRPADTGLPGVTAQLTVTADLAALEGGDAPGEVNGLPVTAAHLRELLTRIGALGLTAPHGGSLSFALTGPNGQLLATLTPAELARLARRGCPQHPDDDQQGCGCPVAGPPPATGAYTPTDRQRAFLTTRDRRCRFPTCGQRVGWADLDHVIARRPPCRVPPRAREWWGARGSFDFAPGWRFRMDPDGTLHVTTPSGVTRTTRPPGMRTRPPAPSTGADPPPANDAPPF